MVKQELAGAEQVLTVMGEGSRAMELRAAASEFADDELGAHLPWVRRKIAAEVLEAAPSPWALSGESAATSEADRLLRQLVECGSEQQLCLIEAGVPASVAAAAA